MPVITPLMQRFGLRHPILQAPMAGGGDTLALVAAVSEAGGMGSIGEPSAAGRPAASSTAS
jgi:nitronate monooxygenase